MWEKRMKNARKKEKKYNKLEGGNWRWMKYGKKEKDDFDFKIYNSNERLPVIRLVNCMDFVIFFNRINVSLLQIFFL